MKARHVWFVLAFVFGIGSFAESVSEHGVMWGWYTVMIGLKVGALATASVLGCLALCLSAERD